MATELPGLLTDRVTRTVYATDNSIYQVEPHGVALPSSAAEIRALLAANHAAADPRPVTARGGGTGTNGQSLTDGVLIDLKRRLDRIVSVDPQAATAVVEPGVVAAALDAELAPHGLFWAPHTSTLNRCTVGGMIATDAAGKGSLVHGRAHRHVRALDAVLADGTPWRAEPITIAEAERRAATDDRGGRLWASLLDLPLVEGADHGLPELARGFSGYGIDRVRRDGLIDPVPLLCGSEGTLAVITSAELALTPLPAHTVLVVVSYDSFALALDDAVDLVATAPTAIESFDETTLAQGRTSPAWPALDAVVGDGPGAVLLVEYSGPTTPDLDTVLAALEATGRHRAARVVTDPDQRAAAWKVRADAVGLLAKVATGGPELSARPTAMVEDCAVPVAAMPAFIAGFRQILDDADLTYGMFGHADVGCVHVRPALDLTDPEHERLVRTITDRVTELVAHHGGVLWGEHGRGFRGDVVASFLTPETIGIMRRVKTAFDPDDLLNPGKLYRPLGRDEPITALDAPPLRGHRNRVVPVALRRSFGDAYACNGNGLCHHYDRAEVMCPSYKATGDPALSPKGRTDLLREHLAVAAPDVDFDDALVENLDRCLSCSACTGHCPVEVDIPELKSLFLERYYRERRRPAGHLLLSRFETLAGLASSLPTPVAALGIRPLARLVGLVDLPVPPRRPPAVAALPRYRPGTGTDLVILPDVFTANLEPSTLVAAHRVLQRLGYATAVAPLTPSGKFDHVKGRRRAFAAAAAAQGEQVATVVADGAMPVMIEPAVALLHGHEYPAIDPGHPSDVRYLGEVIADRLDRLGRVPDQRSITLLGHCTERALAPAWLTAWVTVLASVGYAVSAPAVGCCGMAGIFGHERANQVMSRTLFDQSWAAHVNDARPGSVAATGYSCRSQAKRLAGADIAHPVHLLG